jgi:rhodanese-related sulfurtransferase
VSLQAGPRLERLTPSEALAEQRVGATIIDIRPLENRELEGAIPGALAMPGADLAALAGSAQTSRSLLGQRVIVVCNEGCASAVAVADLVAQGGHDATDVIGGFRAWRARGLPVIGSLADASRI